ncbi:isthmin-2 [Protopterus annectens]|uniref:isthmin-2 n=1 Tax=Protopterus annectens TaxID=7888 RepID=UPI001CFC324F|nr:isthmin-2 [Protopterus annectens]
MHSVQRNLLLFTCLLIWTVLLTLVKGMPAGKNTHLSQVPKQQRAQLQQVEVNAEVAASHGDYPNRVNHVRTSILNTSRRQKRRGIQQYNSDIQTQPINLLQQEEDEETKPFVLDLNNIPDLANADLGAENPNIQVTIEVVDNPQAEVEMDLLKEPRNDWPISSSEWLTEKGLFWPLFWEYTDSDSLDTTLSNPEGDGDFDEDYMTEYDGEDTVLSGIGGVWDRRWPLQKNWSFKEKYNYDYEDEEEWSSWSACSVSCGSGNQKRTRSCGYSCTATEARTCDQERCPGDEMDFATEATPFNDANKTGLLNTDVDSCEKWLNCRSEFLIKYIDKVLTDLPSCPCFYPLEAVYSVVSIYDEKQEKSFRWRDASGPKERLDIYKPTAKFCIRSMLSLDSTTLAAQHCCYDDNTTLITRGKGAGAPNLISTEFSPELHYKVDTLPWILCKGDWSRYHEVRPPNNALHCEDNPSDDIYLSQLEEVKEY